MTADAGPDEVEFRLVVRNESDDPVELTFGSGQTAEFVVSDDSETVWRWSDDRLFTQRVRRETLAPGESVVGEGAWTDPPSGTYTVEATLTATDRRPTASVAFAV